MKANHNRLYSFFVLLIASLFLNTLNSYCQPDVDYLMYKKKYPKEKALYLNNKEEVFIDIVKGELSIYSNVFEERFFLNDKANLFSEKAISYSAFFDISNVEAKTLLPEKKKYKVIKVEDFKTKDDLDGYAFYDDKKTMSFVYPSLSEGAKSVLSYKETLKEPRFLGGFLFGAFVPIEQSELVVSCHEDVELEYKLFGMKEGEYEFTSIKNKNKIIYRWAMKDIKKIESEEQAPNLINTIPHIVIYIKEYKVNGKTKQMLSGVKDLYKWYYSLLQQKEKGNNEELRPLVDSLVKNTTTEIEKAKNIFYWVQDHIKYIAIEDGLGGFIPRNATTVHTKRYGDCKDMANLMHEMMNIAGITSHITWLGTRDIPYSYYDVPTPAADNHMITTYINDSNYYFLDATGKNIPFGYPSSFIQGKEALLSFDSTTFKIVKIPEVPYERNVICDTSFISLEGDKIMGKGITRGSGYYKINIADNFSDLTKKEKLRRYTSFLGKGNNKFNIDSVEETNLNNRDKEVVLRYDFNIQDYAKINDNELYLNMHLNKPYNNDKIKDDRKNDYEKRFKGAIKYVVHLKIPDGYSMEYIPNNESYQHELFGFTANYQTSDKDITLSYQFYTNHLVLEKNYFEDWNKMIKALDNAYSEVVILKKKM